MVGYLHRRVDIYDYGGENYLEWDLDPCERRYRPGTGVQFSSVFQSCPTFCDPMDCSTPGLPVYHQLKLMSIESEMPSNHLILCHPLLLSSISPNIRVFFPMSQFFVLGGQIIGVSASISILPMNIQD